MRDGAETPGMYAVVGCSDCSALWVVSGRPETTRCPRCGTRRQFDKLRTFAETEDAAAAKEVRAAMLADRSGEREAFDAVDSFAALEAEVDDAGMDEEEYIDRAGLDSDAVSEAGERAESGDAGGGTSRKDAVLAALRDLDSPTEAEVVARAAEAGVPESYAREALEKLRRAGEVSESRGTYRLL